MFAADLKNRIASLDWEGVENDLLEAGHARTPRLLTPDECAALAALYADEALFRSRIDMARHRFGLGEYKYFAAPLPPLVQALREHAYARLAPIANRLARALGHRQRFPPTLDALLARCARLGQTKPTPLILRYETGGYNCLHQDLYGDLAFPLQIAIALSRPGVDYTGGDFLLVEQRPRAQSRGEAIALEQGEGVVFPTRERPVKGSRGFYRAGVRHGVSRLLSGERYTLGIIFHDAR